MRRVAQKNKIGEQGYAITQKNIHGSHQIHSHAFYELEYILEGAGEYVIDGRAHTIFAGMLFLMTPLNFHSVQAENCRIIHLVFSERVCRAECLSGLLSKGNGIAVCANGRDRTMIEEVLFELMQNGKDTMYASDLLNVLLGKLLTLQDGLQEHLSPVSRGHLYLLNHFRERPTLSEVAAFAGYTPTYFSAMFKKETGSSYQEYLDDLRFEYAGKLARHASLSMIEVCRESGFDDYPNFLRRFKKRFGCTPAEYRKGKET